MVKKLSCKKGEIRRKSYTRKGSIHVKAACTKAKGKAIRRGSRTPSKERVLPLPSNDMSLTKFGYSTKKSDATRQLALRSAAKKYGYLVTLRHLNLVRNIQATNSDAKKIMANDVKYLSQKYKDSK